MREFKDLRRGQVRIIDIGCKEGGATDLARAMVSKWFGYSRHILPSECLCVDINPKFKRVIEGKGYRFVEADVRNFDFPFSDFYVGFHILEHLPSKEDAQAVLRSMTRSSVNGVVLRLPSFEYESQLARNGLRFAWAKWAGHPTKYQMGDCCALLDYFKINRSINPVFTVETSGDPRIVLEDEDPEALRHEPGMRKKPSVTFNPPVVGEWEILIGRGP